MTVVTPYHELLMLEFCMEKELVEHVKKREKLASAQNQKLDKISEKIDAIHGMEEELVEHVGQREKLTCVQNQKLDKISELIDAIQRSQEQRLDQISDQVERIRADVAYNFPIQQLVVVAILFILTLTLWRAW